MDSQRLSHLLDTIIDDVLAQRKQRLQTRNKVMRVVLSGEDLTTLSTTLDCLAALDRSGYLLVMMFSHSAMQSSLHTACLEGLVRRGIDVLCDSREPHQTEDAYSSLYLPALSSNSLSKIALGIRDNLVCRWAFQALSVNKAVIVTLNTECRPDVDNPLPQALRARLADYANTLVEYGFTVIGQHRTGTKQTLSASPHKQLVTLSDVREYPSGQVLHIGNRTLITPSARDEIRDRGIVIVQSHLEETCIWQR
ncbi:flavoprotein [Pectobacterium wasabiae]|uniref:Flavoprotein domain-containing protein n=1 Tax=Pectobacterium wasabiae TaxID=55208 RepID=A0AAW3EEL8_9GAMM|nr:flavoprotein [Pectobacterium wasabiae]AOR62756.1 hypothetical protein A7983_05640 [Pectobacterium wasabiae CFBP 3304]EJS95585.1 Hypothetical protein Y17_1163 [Pectobacterium wasabiae CFBP 3304]KFX04560.1 hypothetical protein JV38_15710 [Pectobacterium wasabiae]KGA27580.1 hypothetical protein KU73_15700 [Pectobacterium wasabiae]